MNKNIDIVLGGTSRQESVYNAIKNIKSDIVVIHDGARPAIKQEYIDGTIEAMIDFKGVTIEVKSKDTIKITDDCMLLEKDGYKVKVIEGAYTNIKVTTYEDINIIKEFLLDFEI